MARRERARTPRQSSRLAWLVAASMLLGALALALWFSDDEFEVGPPAETVELPAGVLGPAHDPPAGTAAADGTRLADDTPSPLPTSLDAAALADDAPRPPCHLVGRVVDAWGSPLPDALVGLLPSPAALDAGLLLHRREHPDEPPPAPALTVQARSDGRGWFELPLPADVTLGREIEDHVGVMLQLLVQARLHAMLLVDVEWFGEAERVVPDLRLEPEATLVGRVIDSLGRPLIGVDVRPGRWSPPDPAAGGWPPPEPREHLLVERLASTSGNAGVVRLSGLPASWSGRLVLRHEGSVPVASEPIELEGRTGEQLVGDLVLPLDRGLVGLVVDADDEPLPGVAVVLSPSGLHHSDDGTLHRELAFWLERTPELSRLTDAHGRFAFSGLGAPAYRLYAGSPDHVTTVVERLEPETLARSSSDGDPSAVEQLPRPDVVVRLERRAPLLLRVLRDDSDGQGPSSPDLPLETRAEVSVLLVPEAQALHAAGGRWRAPRLRAGSERGTFVLEGVAPRDALLTVEAPGRVSRVAVADGLPVDETRGARHLALVAECVLSGRVVDIETGLPVAGLEVAARPGGLGDTGQDRTDGQGRYRLSKLPATYQVAGVGGERFWTPAPPSTELAADFKRPGLHAELPDILVARLPVGELKGSVVDELGEPVPGRLIVCETHGRQGRSDRQGRFLWRGVSPGLHDLGAPPCSTVEVELLPDESLETTIQITRPTLVTGRVVGRDGGPVPGATIQLLHLSEKTLRDEVLDVPGFPVTSDAEGRFETTCAWQGEGRLQASTDWGSRSQRADVFLAPGATVAAELTLRDQSLEGVVLDAETERGLAGAVVEGRWSGRTWVFFRSRQSSSRWQVTTDADGRFRMPAVPSQAFSLRASAEGFDTAEHEVASPVWYSPLVGLRLVLQPSPRPGELLGWVRHEDGVVPFDGLRVLALEPALAEALDGSSAPDVVPRVASAPSAQLRDGLFAFEPLRPGSYGLVVLRWERRGLPDWRATAHWLETVEVRGGQRAQAGLRLPWPGR